MSVVLALFVLAGVFALAAFVAERVLGGNEQRSRLEPVEGASEATTTSLAEQGSAKQYPGNSLKVIALSNHGAHMLDELTQKRRASEDAIRRHTAILEELSVEEAKIRAGLSGESALDDLLCKHLGGHWTVIAGYRAQEGEIDRILAGPGGIFAFEVKNVSGVIHCDGDRWWRDKTDRRGNIVERGIPIADNGGRSPSRQINDAADALERLLRKNGHDVAVVRVVAFPHPWAETGNINGLTVHALALGRWMDIRRALKHGKPLSEEQVRKIVKTIRRHHEWFERKERLPAKTGDEVIQACSPSL